MFPMVPDEMFADLFTDVGRRSVPPMIVAVVMVLQRLEGLSDREAVDRFAFDARWKYAAGDSTSTIQDSCTRYRWTCGPGWPARINPERGPPMRISADQRIQNENRIRAAIDRLLRGEIPPGGGCDIKTLAATAGVDRTASYGSRPYAHLRAEFEHRLRQLQNNGETPDPKTARIERLKA
jgi:hypothetical protein